MRSYCDHFRFTNPRISSRWVNSTRARRLIPERRSNRSRISITSIGAIKTKFSKPWQVFGVMPPRFTYPFRFSNPPEVWISMSILRTSDYGSRPRTEERDNDFLYCIARLKPGVPLKQAHGNIDTITANWHQQYP